MSPLLDFSLNNIRHKFLRSKLLHNSLISHRVTVWGEDAHPSTPLKYARSGDISVSTGLAQHQVASGDYWSNRALNTAGSIVRQSFFSTMIISYAGASGNGFSDRAY